MAAIDPHRWATVVGAIVMVFYLFGRGLVAIYHYGVPLLLIAGASFAICTQSSGCQNWLCANTGIC